MPFQFEFDPAAPSIFTYTDIVRIQGELAAQYNENPATLWMQVRHPRSKKRRIRKKWERDLRNWRWRYVQNGISIFHV